MERNTTGLSLNNLFDQLIGYFTVRNRIKIKEQSPLSVQLHPCFHWTLGALSKGRVIARDQQDLLLLQEAQAQNSVRLLQSSSIERFFKNHFEPVPWGLQAAALDQGEVVVDKCEKKTPELTFVPIQRKLLDFHQKCDKLVKLGKA